LLQSFDCKELVISLNHDSQTLKLSDQNGNIEINKNKFEKRKYNKGIGFDS